MLHKIKVLRTAGLALLMLTAGQAQAEYQCSVKPQDDVIISPQSVQIVGASGNLQISPDGDVTRNGKTLTLTDAQRQQAFRYQTALRKDLPWIDQARSNVWKKHGFLWIKSLFSNSVAAVMSVTV